MEQPVTISSELSMRSRWDEMSVLPNLTSLSRLRLSTGKEGPETQAIVEVITVGTQLPLVENPKDKLLSRQHFPMWDASGTFRLFNP